MEFLIEINSIKIRSLIVVVSILTLVAQRHSQIRLKFEAIIIALT